jgi:surface antigen
MNSLFLRLFAVMLAAPFFLSSTAQARGLQCVPFARQMSGIDIRGNAKTWWDQAAGRYDRGPRPREGAVLAMPGSGRMRLGHVAMVSRIVSDREILLTHANWSRRGGIERDVRAIDVSQNGDWSRVRIWHAQSGDLGMSSYPVSGFIFPSAARPTMAAALRPALLSADVLMLARLEEGVVNGGGAVSLR